MVTLYMMVGIAGSGKSYFANTLGCPVVSSDAIRAELFGDENDQTHNGEVFEEVHRRIHNYLSNGESCVYDATNLSRKRRVGFLKQLPAGVKKVAVVMATEIDLIYKQNSERERKVPVEVIDRMVRRMQLPQKNEGWDEISFIPHPKNKSNLFNYVAQTAGFDQDNPHHSLSLYQHMSKAGEYAALHFNDEKYNIPDMYKSIAFMAALCHDIGKPLCKTYQLWSGKTDSYAHYYNHAEVGAYLVACCGNNVTEQQRTDLANILIIAQHHMDAFADEKWLDKFEKTYGADAAAVMRLVHDSDLEAH